MHAPRRKTIIIGLVVIALVALGAGITAAVTTSTHATPPPVANDASTITITPVHSKTVLVPVNSTVPPGVFDVKVTDAQGRPVAAGLQWEIMPFDTDTPPRSPYWGLPFRSFGNTGPYAYVDAGSDSSGVGSPDQAAETPMTIPGDPAMDRYQVVVYPLGAGEPFAFCLGITGDPYGQGTCPGG